MHCSPSSSSSSLQWINLELPEELVQNLSKSLDITPHLAALLVRLDITDPRVAQRFLYPRLAHLEDPFKITNMEAAANRIIQAISQKESITILGDYDVDGITSITLLVSVLEYLNTPAHYIIPNRFEEGYGLTETVVARSLEAHVPNLFIALDCGTNSSKEVAFLKNKGIDVLIFDHHQAKGTALPEDTILVNPHVFDSQDTPWAQLCTIGIVFKLIHALFKKLKEQEHPLAQKVKLKDFLDLVAIGTVADLVSLVDENRILTYFGMKHIASTKRPGLQALCSVSGLTPCPNIKPSDISFKIAPRINASGRLANALLPVEMLLNSDIHKCTTYAQKLETLNRERQTIERQMNHEAQQIVNPQNLQDLSSIVLYQPDWHFGIVGIVAGKIARQYHRPSIILAKEGILAKGSGRSVHGINLVTALSHCTDLLESWGGHPMAVGLALKIENIAPFKEKFKEAIELQFEKAFPPPTLEIARWLTSEALNSHFLKELELLHPFGNGNPEPIFGLRNTQITTPPRILTGNHFRFRINANNTSALNGVAWNMADNIPPINTPLELAIKFAWNYWNGRKSPQIQLIAWRTSS